MISVFIMSMKVSKEESLCLTELATMTFLPILATDPPMKRSKQIIILVIKYCKIYNDVICIMVVVWRKVSKTILIVVDLYHHDNKMPLIFKLAEYEHNYSSEEKFCHIGL